MTTTKAEERALMALSGLSRAAQMRLETILEQMAQLHADGLPFALVSFGDEDRSLQKILALLCKAVGLKFRRASGMSAMIVVFPEDSP